MAQRMAINSKRVTRTSSTNSRTKPLTLPFCAFSAVGGAGLSSTAVVSSRIGITGSEGSICLTIKATYKWQLYKVNELSGAGGNGMLYRSTADFDNISDIVEI